MNSSSGFDSDAWKAQRGAKTTENDRARLLVPLERVLHAGMPREEVLALLGEPDSRSEGLDVYRLGVAPFGIDPEFYEIRYRDGKVSSFRLTRG